MFTVRLALSTPASIGAKVTAIVQNEFAASVEPHPPRIMKSAGSAPPMLSLSERVNGDLLVTVTVLVNRSVGSREPYASDVGATVAGIVAGTLSETVCGLALSGLVLIAMVADSLPSAPAVNFTVIVQVAFGAIVVPQVLLLTEKSLALGPPKLSLTDTGTAW